MRTVLGIIAGVAALLLTVAQFGTAGWTKPPILANQHGFRGTGMDQVKTKAEVAAIRDANVAPAPADKVEPGTDKAGTTYENVQVLKDISTEEFNRLMVSITEWVSPAQGCTYCHNTENMADDSLYQKKVARRMLQMVQHINADWKEKHVGEAGVTCYTCHRGNPVPAHVWFDAPSPTRGFIARNNGQNMATPSTGLASLPYTYLEDYLAKPDPDQGAIRVNATTALPESKGKPIQQAERTFALMIHMSESLGVNCTYCHNTRAVAEWSQSTPQRTLAWHGIRMVRDLNAGYITPLTGVFPPNRLGPKGDAPKINCATCHNGQNKPLGGAHVIEAYPELARATAATGAEAPAPMPAPAPAPTPAPAPR